MKLKALSLPKSPNLLRSNNLWVLTLLFSGYEAVESLASILSLEVGDGCFHRIAISVVSGLVLP